jgi:hypothetical protein
MAYVRRILDDALDDLLAALPAVALQGPKGVGKTATAMRRAQTVVRLDDARQRAVYAADPDRLHSLTSPVLIDEWQRLPEVWDHVRRAVDDGATAGEFMLTGSATPAGAAIHSGAGRIVDLRMRPLSLAEREITEPTVSLSHLLAGNQPDIGGTSPVTLQNYVDEIMRSGFPGIRPLPQRARRLQLDSYLDAVVSREFPEQGVILRRPATLRAWLAAYAAATSTSSSYTTILDAATGGSAGKPAKTTTIAYRDVLARLWLLDPVPAWLPGTNRLKRLAKAPKHQLADPALAARLLHVDTHTLLEGRSSGPNVPRQDTLLGALFEHLVGLSVNVYAQANDAHTGHLRALDGGHEIDLIVEQGHGIVALEVKLTAAVNDRDVRHLHWLRNQIGNQLRDAAIITTGHEAYRRTDGIAVIPAALLGP